jgi:hypothetical protein
LFLFITIFAGKSNTCHVLCTSTVGGGVANNLNDSSHLPQLAESFFVY